MFFVFFLLARFPYSKCHIHRINWMVFFYSLTSYYHSYWYWHLYIPLVPLVRSVFLDCFPPGGFCFLVVAVVWGALERSLSNQHPHLNFHLVYTLTGNLFVCISLINMHQVVMPSSFFFFFLQGHVKSVYYLDN